MTSMNDRGQLSDLANVQRQRWLKTMVHRWREILFLEVLGSILFIYVMQFICHLLNIGKISLTLISINVALWSIIKWSSRTAVCGFSNWCKKWFIQTNKHTHTHTHPGTHTHTPAHVCVYMYIQYVYMYVYTETKRQRKRGKERKVWLQEQNVHISPLRQPRKLQTQFFQPKVFMLFPPPDTVMQTKCWEAVCCLNLER